jgi:hypothetical protein
VLAAKELRRMDQGLVDPEGRGMTQAARVLGIVSVVLLAIGVVAGGLILLFQAFALPEIH